MADKKEFRELTDEETEQVAGGDALTFEVELTGDPVEVQVIKDVVGASSDLTDLAKKELELMAEFDDPLSKVTINPKDSTDKAFMKVVIPKDPGVE